MEQARSAVSITNADLAKLNKKLSRRDLEGDLWRQFERAGIASQFVRKFIYAPPRKFEFDFYCASARLGVEVQGALWAKGQGEHSGAGHSHPMWIRRDNIKANLAVERGYRLLRFDDRDIDSGDALNQIMRVLNRCNN